jgi:PD-(D/E)XK nuclease superfamily protein
MICADLLRRGFQIALPLGHDLPFDIIAIHGHELYRVQCKYSASKGDSVIIRCRRTGQRSTTHYIDKNIDWFANFDETTGRCFYIPSSELGPNGRNQYSIRLKAEGSRKRSRRGDNFEIPPLR